jgi:hypothetical protein
MAIAAANVWTQWLLQGSGGSYTIDSSGVLNIIDGSTSTNQSLYLMINVQGGDVIEFSCKAKANSGQGRQWINYGSIGSASGGKPEMLIANNTDYRPSVLKAVVPASFDITTCYIGVGCTTPDIGDISVMEPVVTLNGTQIYFGMDPNSNPIRFNASTTTNRTVVSQSSFVDVNGGYNALYNSVGTINPVLRMAGYSSDTTTLGIVRYSNDVETGLIRFAKTRTAVPGDTPVATVSGDSLGSIDIQGDNGTSFVPGARIDFVQDDTAAAFVPTAIRFRCSTDVADRTTRLTLTSAGELRPGSNNAQDLGTTALKWANTYSTNFYPGSSGTVVWTSGANSPEGVVTAPVGSLFTRTNGGAGSTLYVKETGTGNTGWVAK